MELYTKEQVASLASETFAFIKVKEADNVLTITLNREEKKNALHPHMVNELAYVMQYAKVTNSVWVVVIEAAGTVFCSGADLKAFMGMVGEFDSSIPKPEGEVLIGELFNKVHKPVITKVNGDVYAGGFFFLAGATYVVASDAVKLGLPEVKRGLFPYQVMASLLKVMAPRNVIDWCIRGYNLPVEKATEWGLVTHCVNASEIDATVEGLINELKQNSPTAIRLGLEALDHITGTAEQHKYLMEMLQKTASTKDGVEGLMAFREKRKPVWTGS